MDITTTEAQYLLEHVTLPPRLPQQNDWNERHCDVLLQFSHEVLSGYISHAEHISTQTLLPSRLMLQRMASAMPSGAINAKVVLKTLGDISIGDMLPIHVREQNAALIIRRTSEGIHFDCFEASPQTGDIIQTQDALVWTFPSDSIIVPYEIASSLTFRTHLANFLAKMSVECIPTMLPVSRKAQSDRPEIRDTANPKMILHLLMNTLLAYGVRKPSKLPITKRVRDDVLWKDAYQPWRRNPLWLLIRVGLQTSLQHHTPQNARKIYKEFMVYYMCRLCRLAKTMNLSPELVSTGSAKISRRISKLGSSVNTFIHGESLGTCQQAIEYLQNDWTRKQEACRGKLAAEMQFESHHTNLKLANSKKYLDKIMENSPLSLDKPSFLPKCTVRDSSAEQLPALDKALAGSEPNVALADFEKWVTEHLSAWTLSQLPYPDASTCTKLGQLLSTYFQAATRRYSTYPDQLSFAILTSLEVWQSFDKLVIALHPLLEDYSPDISLSFVEPLILPRKELLDRLHCFEAYLAHRHNRCVSQNPSIFSNPQWRSFTVQFYHFSTRHQTLKQRIEEEARRQRAYTTEQHRIKRQHCSELRARAATKSHKQLRNQWNQSYHEAAQCGKCMLERQAKEVTLAIHEWPLPSNIHDCESAVVELAIPRAFAIWRDVTYEIQKLGRPPVQPHNGAEETILRYPALDQFRDSSYYNQTITLGSKAKTFTKSHYRNLHVDQPLEDFLVPCGLRYEIYHSVGPQWLSTTINVDMRPKLSYCDQSGRYKQLHKYTLSTTHSTNEVISDQTLCTEALTLHEFISYGSLRSGISIQWLIILRELTQPNLSWKNIAIYNLVFQATHQVEARNSQSPYRQALAMLKDDSFCLKLIDVIGVFIERVEANWNEINCIAVATELLLKVFSFTDSTIAQAKCLSVLDAVRKITSTWIEDLIERLFNAECSDQVRKSQHDLVYMACICRRTFDRDYNDLIQAFSSTDDVTSYIKCAIVIKDNCPDDIMTLPLFMSRAIFRDQMMSHRLQAYLEQAILSSRECIDKAIRHIWHHYEPHDDTPWTVVPLTGSRWLRTQTHELQEVHYDLLTGQLLVDGKRLGRLPSSYTQHGTYSRVFGNRILDVLVSSIVVGMEYTTEKEIHGYQVLFAMREGELVIRTRLGDETLELIPHHRLRGDLPKLLMDDYTHWMNIDSGSVELRPLDSLWEPSGLNWRIDYSQYSRTSMHLGTQQLVDVHSDLFNVIAKNLESIECSEFLHVTSCSRAGLHIQLPRYNFNFHADLKTNTLYSTELGAIIDPDQDIGTLIGLQSKLVLKEKQSLKRSVIIPIGKVNYRIGSSFHVLVNINTFSDRHVRYCQYHVDPILCRLLSSPKLYQGYYLAYLHALTSHTLPDPLTRMNGTEQALTILRQACMLPTDPLQEEEVSILELVAQLTPAREFYPPHLQKMQTVFWDPNLPSFSQHDEFVCLADQFFHHSRNIEHFFPQKTYESELFEKLRTDNDLLQRARIRNSGYRQYEFGGNQILFRRDQNYQLRDPEIETQAEQQVFESAYLLRQRPSRLAVHLNLWGEVKSWNNVLGPQPDFGPLSGLIGFRPPNAFTSLYNYCQSHRHPEDALKLTFVMGTIALMTDDAHLFKLIRSLISLTISASEMPNLPPYTSYEILDGCEPNESSIRTRMKDFAKSYDWEDPNASTIALEIDQQASDLTRFYMNQWRCETPHAPSSTRFSRLLLTNVKAYIDQAFGSCYRNDALHRHILALQSILNGINGQFILPTIPPRTLLTTEPRDPAGMNPLASLHDLFKCTAPAMPDNFSEPPVTLIAQRLSVAVTSRSSAESADLSTLIKELQKSQDSIEQSYGQVLGTSLSSYLSGEELVTPSAFPWSSNELSLNVQGWENYVSLLYNFTVNQLQAGHGSVGEVSRLSGLAPKIEPVHLLSILGGPFFHELSGAWQKTLVYYVEALTQFQRAVRLESLMKRQNLLAFYKESEHTGREGWSSSQFPSWLAMEADNDLMIRPVQARVALEMLSSRNSQNSVLQLNMGDGKSSVTVPLLLLSLSDGHRLARAVVLDSLAKPMRYILRRTIGRTLQRPVYYIPFSRRIPLKLSVITNIMLLQKTCLNERGVLLAQPEHMLSFKLIGIERLWAHDYVLAQAIFRANAWMNSTLWDVIDECDAVLVDNQLIYTVGAQQIVHGGSERWKTVQEILGIAMAHAERCHSTFPQYVELASNGAGNFPIFRMSDPKAGRFLAQAVANQLKRDMIINTNFSTLSSELQDAILAFVMDRECPQQSAQAVERYFLNRPSSVRKLLILRGFLAKEILYSLLESKRWRVDYGLDSSRCQMVVPYIAKDVPSPRAEFGHPDIALGLTCLSYYFDGLTSDQLLRCFEKLRTASDPSIIYQEWVAASELPDLLRYECNINLEDEGQWNNEIYPGLKRQKAVVDFFLNHFVFPKEAKEFPKKLPASGWDIPSSTDTRCVGFSGTNDSNGLLPLSIKPQNLPELLSTGARILVYVLQSVNQYLCAKDSSGNQLSVPDLLRLIHSQSPKVTVLLDAGAQVLELRNRQVVQKWLELCPDSDAAIYFDEKADELMVLKRDDTTEPLVSSIYNAQTDRCLVYLDQVRTRGTDLKFPPGTRAAVTISRKLGKDAAIQAFMRLRDFGHRHSVLVIAPPEIDYEIRTYRRDTSQVSDDVGMDDVLRWLFKQTVRNIAISMPGWVEQGLSHRRREIAADSVGIYDRNLKLNAMPESKLLKLVRTWEEDEAKSLESLYSPSRGSQLLDLMNSDDPDLANDGTYQSIVKTGKQLCLQDHDITSRQQTYQREIELEAEIIREIQRPAKAVPMIPSLHKDIQTFVKTGKLSEHSTAVIGISQALMKFSFANLSQAITTPWSGRLFVSSDFAITVKSALNDEYANPVNWILVTNSNTFQRTWIVISQFEANALMDYVLDSKFVQLHVYAPTTRRIRSFIADDMKFFVIPPTLYVADPQPDLQRDLSLFAGRLYLTDESDYQELLQYIQQRNGGEKNGLVGPFFDLIKALLEMRRKGEDLSRTHLGRVMEERRLEGRDFE